MRSTLYQTARKLVAPGKGILAADESVGTADKRFDKYGIPKTPDMRRKWRQLLFTTPGIEKGLSGVILFDETIRQTTDDGAPFAELLAKRGITAGIKVDQKTEVCASSVAEEVTKGLDGLAGRLREYVGFGAQFTKWRAVIRIGALLPTQACLRENARRLAAYALHSQQAGLVPILEPEVLLDGDHTLTRSEEVLAETLATVFDVVKKTKADLKGMLLKSSMALPGKDSGEQAADSAIAEATLRAFKASVPREVPGIVFLSGGQTPAEAANRLNAIVKLARVERAPWKITFSFSRALQEEVLAAWRGQDEQVKEAQAIFQKRVEETALASEGKL